MRSKDETCNRFKRMDCAQIVANLVAMGSRRDYLNDSIPRNSKGSTKINRHLWSGLYIAKWKKKKDKNKLIKGYRVRILDLSDSIFTIRNNG